LRRICTALESAWWGLKRYPLCFNFHQSGHLFSYEEQTLEEGQWRQIFEEGEWTFHEPNEYLVIDTSIFVYKNEECWDIEEYFDTKTITACECTILGE
jgi:hypothetical protein